MAPEEILILTAVRQEADAIRRLIRHSRPRIIGIKARFRPEQAVLDRAGLILICGLGGGLDPALGVGEVVVDDPDELLGRPHPATGRIFTTDKIVAEPAEKRDLFRRTGARVVDMEQAIVAGWAPGKVVGVRAVSDAADQTLDPRVLALIDPTGRPKPLAVAKLLATSPASLATLLRLHRDSSLALKNLARAVAGMLHP